MCQNVQRLTFNDRSFDLVSSTEVLEHVPDYKKAFGEIYRVLKSGGKFIFTVPLYLNMETSQRASMSDQGLVHIKEPVYHGDHLRKKGALVFWDFGSDFVKSVGNCGYEVVMHTVENKKNGIIPPKEVFVATKV